ncbi:MAG: NAD(P)-dependent oxidoreductase, partial [Acidobacteriota bacterium]
DHVDIEVARERGIEVLSLRGEEEFLSSITGTAELAFGLLIDLARRVPWALRAVERYEWNREQFRGHSFSGKTLGIVGLGRLGRIMTRQAAGFGVRVIFFDPYVAAPSPRFFSSTPDVSPSPVVVSAKTTTGSSSTSGVFPKNRDESSALEAVKVNLDTLLSESDAISIHVHLTHETEGMFGEREFEQMKPSAYLVNTSRGKIVDERALLFALEQNKIAGYGTDVLADELSFETAGFAHHPLVEYAKTHENLLIVPHIGGMTVESRAATDIFIAQKLVRYLRDTAAREDLVT